MCASLFLTTRITYAVEPTTGVGSAFEQRPNSKWREIQLYSEFNCIANGTVQSGFIQGPPPCHRPYGSFRLFDPMAHFWSFYNSGWKEDKPTAGNRSPAMSTFIVLSSKIRNSEQMLSSSKIKKRKMCTFYDAETHATRLWSWVDRCFLRVRNIWCQDRTALAILPSQLQTL